MDADRFLDLNMDELLMRETQIYKIHHQTSVKTLFSD